MEQIAFGSGTALFNRNPQDANAPLAIETVKIVTAALKAGFKHLDTAEVYNTEREIGEAFRQSGMDRKDVFITTKAKTGTIDCKIALTASLKRLGLDYVDLYLLHSPFEVSDLNFVWKSMIDCQKSGLAKQIGVSNFQVEHLKQIIDSEVKPCTNQIEFHPYLQQEGLISFCKSHGIKVHTYSQLASLVHSRNGPVDPVVIDLAKKYSCTENEILFAWIRQQGFFIVTTTLKEERLKELLTSIMITDQEAANISAAGKQLHYRKWWSSQIN